jgi:hypothetical protein
VNCDSPRDLISAALMLLEMTTEVEGGLGCSHNYLVWAAHSLSQRALGILCGSKEPTPLSRRTIEIISDMSARLLIADAQEASKHG